MWQYSYNLRGLYETPDRSPKERDRRRPSPRPTAIIDAVAQVRPHHPDRVRIQAAARRLRHPHRAHRRRRHRGRRRRSADEIGFPIVLKLYSETITHKTDVGGVQLNLQRRGRRARRLQRASSRPLREKAGAQHFQGVTVQPMIKLRRLRAHHRHQPSTRSSARCSCSAPAASSSRSSRTAPSPCRRSTPRWPAA